MWENIPELRPMGGSTTTLRLPELDSIPLTRRVLAVIDHPHFQRLRRVRQLGPTAFVYPGAMHSRFEHAIGVYGTTRRYLQALLQLPNVSASLSSEDILTLLLAGLLHDVGHYPYAHSLEAAHHAGVDVPRHEDLAESIILGRAPGLPGVESTLAGLLSQNFNVDPNRVIQLIRCGRRSLASPIDRLLQSVISSAIDADKMDYLWRDSVHLGVPYGRNYDRERLLNALTVNEEEDAIAISTKGLISAEIFLFCRYTMYSEVYWHHTVRSASCMLERAWEDHVVREQPSTNELTSVLLSVGDDACLETLFAEAKPRSAAVRYLEGIAGVRRRLYKRLFTWSRTNQDETGQRVYQHLYGLDREMIRQLEARIQQRLGKLARPMAAHSIVIDVPPRDKDRTPDLDVRQDRAIGGKATFTSLVASSAIVKGISEDFLNVVKKIRLLVHPDYAPALQQQKLQVYEAVVDEILGG